MQGPLDGAVALVTGASRGLGAALAIELARLGAHPVITARTQGGLEETDDTIRRAGGAATLLPLDLREAADVDKLGPSIWQRFQRLDILAHCAGSLGRLAPISHLMPYEWADALEVNFSAPMRLMRTCEPLLRKADAGRAVFVTDARARRPKAYWAAYAATKAGMEHLVLTWADELESTPVRVNLFDPGPMATRLRRDAFPGELPNALPDPAEVAPSLVALCLPSEQRTGASVTR